MKENLNIYKVYYEQNVKNLEDLNLSKRKSIQPLVDSYYNLNNVLFGQGELGGSIPLFKKLGEAIEALEK